MAGHRVTLTCISCCFLVHVCSPQATHDLSVADSAACEYRLPTCWFAHPIFLPERLQHRRPVATLTLLPDGSWSRSPAPPRRVLVRADVFFVHGTGQLTGPAGNFMMENNEATPFGEFVSLQLQPWASCRVFAPLYKAASMVGGSFDVAYRDVSEAFRTYLAIWGGQRPITLVGHSQGGVMVLRLLKEFFRPGSALRGRLIEAYTPGIIKAPGEPPIPEEKLLLWNTASATAHIKNLLISHWGKPKSTINPTIWARGKHLGVIGVDDRNEAVIYHGLIGSVIRKDGLLRITPASERADQVLQYFRSKLGDYHSSDIHLFSENIREHVERY